LNYFAQESRDYLSDLRSTDDPLYSIAMISSLKPMDSSIFVSINVILANYHVFLYWVPKLLVCP